MLSIIIPIYNEAKILVEKRDYYLSLKNKAEVLFVDGGSTDDSAVIAAEYGKVIASPQGRAVQKNRGVVEAPGDMFLFLHVDSFISDEALKRLKGLNGTHAGCLTMAIEDRRLIFRLYERVVNNRAIKKGLVDGDLGLFVTRAIFNQLNGFKELTIMDDIEFSERLRKICTLSVLPEKIYVSSRRWDEHGFISTFWRYTLAYIQHYTGWRIFK